MIKSWIISSFTLVFLTVISPLQAELTEAKQEQISSAIFDGNSARLRQLLRGEDLAQLGTKFMHEAVFFDRVACARVLIEAGAPADAADQNGMTPLMSAVDGFNQNMSMVRLLVESGADVNAVNLQGEDVLTQAAQRGSSTLTNYLIEHGAHVRPGECTGGDNAIISASAGGNLRFLQNAIGDVRRFINSRGARNMTALMAAAKEGKWSTYQFLLQQGADWTLADADNTSLLMHAIDGGDIRIIRDLIAKGVDVNHFNNHRDNPLSRALWKNRPDIVKLLMENGANASLPFGPFNKLPIEQAMGSFSMQAFNELVKHLNQDQLWQGFDKLTTGVFRNPAHYREFVRRIEATPERRNRLMAEAGGFGDVATITRLRGMGVDLDATDGRTGENALMKAAKEGKNDAVSALLRMGARFDQRNSNGDNALHLAASDGEERVIRTLVRAGMNVNEHDNDGNTPLHRAITRGDLASVNTLLAVGAEIDHPGNHSQTPLMTATRLGKVEMVQRLARTANVSYPDVNGTTPLGHAIAARNVDVTRALLAACAPLDELDSSHASADVLLSRGFFREQQTAQIRQLVEARRNNPRCR